MQFRRSISSGIHFDGSLTPLVGNSVLAEIFLVGPAE
jgi:hypothetical protein